MTKVDANLDRKVQESIEVLREAKRKFSNPVILWAGGKDSTVVLDLARKSVPKNADFPFKVCLLDTTYQFQETYNFMDRVSDLWGIEYEKVRNTDALEKNVSPWSVSKFECCNKLKIGALKRIIERDSVEAIIEGVRWDEHDARGKNVGESGDMISKHVYERENPLPHINVHPIENWTEDDVWEYTEVMDLPTNPLYGEDYGYRSIGCWPCTEPVEDDDASERSGRAQDKEKLMERLKKLGYL